ncbi:ubiquitin-specific protease otu1, partial [Dimargaris xerosporica]
LEIMSVDVRDHHIDYYGKGRYPERVFLLYTGSHYDAVGLAADYNDPFEYDQTIFPAHDPSYVSAAVRLSIQIGA